MKRINYVRAYRALHQWKLHPTDGWYRARFIRVALVEGWGGLNI